MTSPFGTQAQTSIIKSIPLDIVGGNTFGQYQKISSAETFNMMMSDNALVPFFGYKTASIISPNGEAREIYNSVRFNHLIVVVDNGVYTVDTGLGVSLVGRLNTSSGQVYIAENLAEEIAIVDGLFVYLFNYNLNTFSVITVDFSPVYIAYQDTYFIAAAGGTNQWRLSGNNDGTSWPPDAQHVGDLQTKPVNCTATVPLNRQLFIFGQTVSEPWYDVGATLFPYQRSNAFAIGMGVLSPATIATNKDIMVWLGSNEKSGTGIFVSTGGEPQQISTDGINFKLNQLTAPQNSFGFLFKLNGHIFYQITFTTDNLTYVYDFETKKFFTLTDQNLNHHIAKRMAFFNGNYYFVSFIDGNLYQMGSEYYTYDGNEIPRIRFPSHIRLPNAARFRVTQLNLTMQQGVGTDPARVDLSISKDGGISYGNVVSRYLNLQGNVPNKFRFFNVGVSNDLVPQFRFWGLNNFVVTNGIAELYA